MKNSPNSVNFSIRARKDDHNIPFIEVEEKVRYSETDQMGIAHNKNYFEWFELGRTEYCRQKKIPYQSIEQKGYYLVVVEAYCKYKKALRYDEKFIIRISLKTITPKKIIFLYNLFSIPEKKLIATGYTAHVVTDAKAEVCQLPPEIIEKMKS